MYWFHVVSVERSKAIYNISHKEYIGFMSWLSKDESNWYINGTTLFKLHVVTVGTYNTKYNKIPHIPLVSCHDCRKMIQINISMVQHYLNYMSWLSKRTTQNTIKYHIFHWFHVVSVERHNFPWNYNVYSNSKSSNYNILQIEASNYTKLRIKPSNYKHFELNYM